MIFLTSSTAIWATVLGAVGLMAATVGMVIRLSRNGSGTYAQARRRRRLPTQWPLNPRPLANNNERHVWHWLRAVFPDHHIMLKLPLTRFTMPRQPGEGRDWFEVLSGAYCSFTVCDARGQVVGCVDVLGPQGLSRGNRQLKQTLLTQCGIGYWVVAADSLPAADVLRAEFLGIWPTDPQPSSADRKAELEAMRHHLHEILDRNRHDRYHRALETAGDAHHNGELAPWQQADSFLGALDSRDHASLQ